MEDDFEAQRLLIKNLQLFEQMVPIEEEVSKKVFECFDEVIRAWVDARSDWTGVYDYFASETSFKPNAWPSDSAGSYIVYFSVGAINDNEQYQSYLSPFVGAVKSRGAISFKVNAQAITGQRGRGSRPMAEWQRFLADHPVTGELRDAGFLVSDGALHLPLRLSLDELAASYPSCLGDAMGPLHEALVKLDRTSGLFNRLVDDAGSYFRQ